MDFVQVPRGLIEDQSIGDKRVLVFLSISLSRWTGCNVNELVSHCGYSINNRNHDSAYQQVEDIANDLISRGYMGMRTSRVESCTYHDCFGAIYRDEFDKVMYIRNGVTSYDRRVNHAHLLLLLACIRCYMAHKAGVPQIYSNLIKRIAEHIGISARSVSNCIHTLEDLDIIHSEELPRYKDSSGHWHSNVRIFVNRHDYRHNDVAYDWRIETKRGISMILASQLE